MIYARVDVALRDHRLLSLGVAELEGEPRREKRKALLGLFVWSLLYCRDHRLSGSFPVALADDEGVPDLVRRLVEVELWTLSADGSEYRVRNYAAKNDTAEVIAERVTASRARKERSRGARRELGAALPGQLPLPTIETRGDVAPDQFLVKLNESERERPVTRMSRVPSGSDSLSGSDQDPDPTRAHDAAQDSGSSERVAPRDVASGPGAPAPMSARLLPRPPPAAASPTVPPPDIPITADLRALCARAGWPTPTPADAARCLQHALRTGRRSLDWGAELALWMSRERRAGPTVADAAEPAARRRRIDDEQRRTDREARERERAAVPLRDAGEQLRRAMAAVA